MKKRLVILLLFFICGCGVKGKPLPPLEQIPIGQGEPNYSKATKDLQIKKKKTKKIKDDWDEPEDFTESENK